MKLLTIDDIEQRHNDLYTKVIDYDFKEALKEYLQIQGNKDLLDKYKKAKGDKYNLITDFNKNINEFIEDVRVLSETVEYFDDYRWLSNIAVKWHSVFSTILEAPRLIKLSPPKAAWSPRPSPNMTDESIDDFLNNYKQFALIAQQASNNEMDVERANQSAKILFASEVLEGKINFSRISSESYWRLEEIWVQQVKTLRAYFNWLESGSRFYDHNKHFFEVTNYIRGKLVDKEIKARPSGFKETKNYIQSRYLDENGKLREVKAEELEKLIRAEASRIYEITGYTDEKKNWQLAETHIKPYCSGEGNKFSTLGKDVFDKRKAELVKENAYYIYKITGYSSIEKNRQLAEIYVNEGYENKPLGDDSLKLSWLIREKANRIYETTGSTDREHNWILAETYVRMFYENIIPAVVQNDKEKVLRVLKAFQYSKTSGFLINNCFEVASAIYFLNPETIQSLWVKSKDEPVPESNVESVVPVNSWPEDFTVDEPVNTRLWISKYRNEIDFEGVMLEVERDALLTALKLATSGNPAQEHIDAIEALYKQSRLIHEETTL